MFFTVVGSIVALFIIAKMIMMFWRDYNIIKMIDAFEEQCEKEDYTDTGDVWEILNVIRNSMRD